MGEPFQEKELSCQVEGFVSGCILKSKILRIFRIIHSPDLSY